MAKSTRTTIFNCLLFLALLGKATLAAASGDLRCGNRLVSVDDTKAEVLIKCGAPAWKDNWTDELINNVNTADELRVSVARERWVYNFGPNSFLSLLLFENGKLIKISTGGYGYNEQSPPTQTCGGDEIKPGLTQYEILQHCGEPFFKDTRSEERLMSADEHSRRLTTNRIDEWTYNLGPNRFLRILIFENGMLTDIRTGDRGF